MRILLFTNVGSEVASAREWFYQMYQLLSDRDIDVSLNVFDKPEYDIIIILRPVIELIKTAVEHSPKAHIGVLNPGELSWADHLNEKHKAILNNIDFFLVVGFMWRDLLLKFNKRVYEVIDYEYTKNKEIKNHKKTDNITIGYHGNILHYSKDFFPNGAQALKRLAKKYNYSLKILTNNVDNQPRIKGVNTDFIEWELDSYESHLSSFDIGICPYFSTMNQLADPFVYIRNPNRINSLLFYGIPSVASPIPQNCQVLRDHETVLFAISEDGWYHAIEKLITHPKLRNKIGRAGKKMVEENFSSKVATSKFIEMLNDEIEKPVSVKMGISESFIKKLNKQPYNFLRKIKGINN